MPIVATHDLDLNRLPPALAPLREPIYNGLDCCLTAEINDALRSLPSAAASAAVYNFELALQAPVLEMTLRGFRVDPMERDRAIALGEHKLKATVSALKRMSSAVADFEVNYNSGPQLKALFYEAMGIKPVVSFVKGEIKEQMDREAIETMLNYFYARPIAYAVLLARDLRKMLGVLKTDIDSDWRWRCSYNIGGTESWRFSSSKSPFVEQNEGGIWRQTGNNFQNITSDLRRVFIADPGFKLAGIDKEQAESREVGFLCGVLFDDWSYLDACESGDLHTYTCRLIWNDLPWTGNLKADKKIAERLFYRHFTYRDMSKRGGHATNYYGKPPTISSHLNVPVPFIERFQQRYFEAFPCIQRLHTWVGRELQTKQHLVNVFGARRDFFDRPNTDETLRSAIAHLFQSATAMDLNLGLLRIWRHMGTRVQILAQLHDAVYFQFSEDEREADVIAEAQALLDVELNCRGRRFIVPTEAKTGYNWAPRWKLDAKGTPVDWNSKGLDKVRMN